MKKLFLAIRHNDLQQVKDIISKNPDYSDILIFEGGENLLIPKVDDAETEEAVAPWKR